jgi:hypothetical protein
MVKQMAQLLGHDENMVRMIQATFNDGVNQEIETFANNASHSPILTHEELEDGGKEAANEYADSYLSRIREQESGKEIKNSYAGKETPSEFDPFDKKKIEKSMNTKSPMSKITRPDRPATGASAKKK